MEVALLSHQTMVIAPLLYPSSTVSEPIESEARGPLEMFFNARHVIHWAPLFDAQCFLLIREEVCEELFLQLHPIRLLKGGSVVFVVDPEHILQVLLPPSTVKFCHQSSGITVGGLRPTSPLRLSFQVPLVVEHLALTQRSDHPPDMAAAHSPSPVCLWGD